MCNRPISASTIGGIIKIVRLSYFVATHFLPLPRPDVTFTSNKKRQIDLFSVRDFTKYNTQQTHMCIHPHMYTGVGNCDWWIAVQIWMYRKELRVEKKQEKEEEEWNNKSKSYKSLDTTRFTARILFYFFSSAITGRGCARKTLRYRQEREGKKRRKKHMTDGPRHGTSRACCCYLSCCCRGNQKRRKLLRQGKFQT